MQKYAQFRLHRHHGPGRVISAGRRIRRSLFAGQHQGGESQGGKNHGFLQVQESHVSADTDRNGRKVSREHDL